MAERKKKSSRKRGPESTSSGGDRSNTMTWVLLVVAAAAVAIVGWNLIGSATDRTVRTEVQLEDTSAEALVALAQPASLGPEDAPVVVMDFSDYSCPACRQFAGLTKPLIVDEYVDRGLVKLEYYDYPITRNFPHSFVAARAARCAGDQGQYWEFHDRLFQEQTQWSRQSDPVGTFDGYASDLGLDRGDFRSCVRSDAHAEAVTASKLLGDRLGVSGTPSIFLNTREGSPIPVGQWGDRAVVRGLLNDNLIRLGHLPDGEGDDEDGTADGAGDGDVAGADS